MKNIVNMTAMVLIVSISAMAVPARGQTTRKPKPVVTQRTYRGCGVYNINVQNETDSATIASTSYLAVFGDIKIAEKIFRTDLTSRGISQQQIMNAQSKWIASQLGGNFYQNNPGRYIVRDTLVHNDFWQSHDDGYFIPEQGTNFLFCDPTTSSAHSDRGTWVVMIITDTTNGLSCMILANCGNPILPKETTGYNETITKNLYAQAGPSGSNTNINIIRIEQPKQQPQSVVFRRQPTQWEENLAENNTQCHTGRTVLICTAVAVAVFIIYELAKPKRTTSLARDNTYNNQFQGGSGSSGATGGTGSQQTY